MKKPTAKKPKEPKKTSKEDASDPTVPVELEVEFKGYVSTKMKLSEAKSLAEEVDEGKNPEYDELVHAPNGGEVLDGLTGEILGVTFDEPDDIDGEDGEEGDEEGGGDVSDPYIDET